MTLNEVVFDIKELIQANSDDRAFDFPEPHILFIYEEQRALTINKLNNRAGRVYDSQLYQTTIMEVEQVDRSFCPLVPIGCKIARTKERLPSSFLYNHRHALVDRVGGNDVLSKKYKFMEYPSIENVFGGAHAHKYVYTFELNGYIYLVSKNNMVKALGNVVVRAIYEQPSKVIESGICSDGSGGLNCDIYPMPNRFHTMAKQGTLEQLINKYQIPADKDNNSDEDLVQMQRKSNAKS